MMTYSRGLQVPRGYEIADPKRSRYLGSPDRIINRFRWNARKKLKISLNMKKDAGEPFSIKDKRMGFDYYSGSILINKLGPFEQIVVGDYLLQFGQGLSLWNGPIVGRSASVANIKVGANLLKTQFSLPLKLNTKAHSRYRFEGQNLQNVSAYYQYNLYNMLLFGESAHSFGSGWAHNHGLIAALGRKFSASISYRNYAKDYHTFFAQSLQAQSNLSNEKAWSLGFAFQPNRKIEWMNSVDYVKFPWMKFRTKDASYSFQGRTQISYIWYKKGHLRLRYQYKFYQENYPATQKGSIAVADVSRQHARLIFMYKLNNSVQIGHQIEVKEFHKSNLGKKHGFMAYQDLIWNKPTWRMGGNLRFAYFNAESYESRLYAYERDVLYGFSFPSYFRKGFRAYLNQKMRPIKGIDIWLRYALTHYLGQTQIGSGLDQISGNKKSDIKLQIRYSW